MDTPEAVLDAQVPRLCVCVACGPPWRERHPEPGPDTSPLLRAAWRSWMSICPRCGDKRCAGAIDHTNPCARSHPFGVVIPDPSKES